MEVDGVTLARPSTDADEDLLFAYEADLDLRGLGGETKRHYLAYAGIVAEFLRTEGKELVDIQKRTALQSLLVHLRKDRGVAPPTIHHYFSALSSLCEFLLLEGRISTNPIPAFRKRYLNDYRSRKNVHRRKIVSVEEMGRLVNSVLDPRDRAILTVLAKTGVRRGELAAMDVGDIDWENGSILLKPRRKRTNRLVFLDEEALRVVRTWLQIRDAYLVRKDDPALFVGDQGTRLHPQSVYVVVTKHAARMGYHVPESGRIEDKFTPHCFRHWFTTVLRRAGMRRELIQELRGDSRRDAIDIYDHIDPEELRREYLRCMPLLGL
jgi:integrase/recombinase XerD